MSWGFLTQLLEEIHNHLSSPGCCCCGEAWSNETECW